MTGFLLALQRTGLPSHSKLDDAMFWVGALFVFTPIVAAGSVLGYIFWQRRHRRAMPPADDPPRGGGDKD